MVPLTSLIRNSIRLRLLHLLVNLLLQVVLLLLDHLQLLPEGHYRVARRRLGVAPAAKVAHEPGHHSRSCLQSLVCARFEIQRQEVG